MTKARVNADNVTADIAGITAGTGITGGGTSGTVTITNDMATTIAAKGDILAGTANDAYSALTVGSNDTVLTADSSTATGLKWAAPAAGGMTLLSTTALSGNTTVTISGIPSTFNNLQIVVTDVNSGSTFNCAIKPNNISPDTLATVLVQGSSSLVGASLSDFGNYYSITTTGKTTFVLNIYDYASARYKNAFMSAVMPSSSGDVRLLASGGYTTSTVISSLTITASSSMTAGTCLIYGVK